MVVGIRVSAVDLPESRGKDESGLIYDDLTLSLL